MVSLYIGGKILTETMESIYIIFYIILWLLALSIYYHKNKTFDAGLVLMISYLIYAISSYVLYTDENFTNLYYGLTLPPFLVLFALLYITSTPIFSFSSSKIENIQCPSMKIVNFFCWMYILMSLLSIPAIISKMNLMAVIMSSQGADLYAENVSDSVYTASSMGDGISNIVSLYTNFFSRLSVLFLFYHLTFDKINKKIVIGLIISIIIYIFSFLLTGQRGGTFKMVSACIITYFALRKFIQPTINKTIFKCSIVGMILICIPYYFLTVSRFSDITDSFSSAIYSYIGQGNLNFNLYAFDNNGIRYGDRTVPLFKKMLGFDNVPNNFWERRWKYPHLKINDESFITFVGDFVLDYGVIIATIFLCLLSFFILRKTKIKNRKIYFHQLVLLHFIMCMCMEGGMSLYSFADSSNMVIVVYIFMYMLFRFNCPQKTIYNKINI